MNTCCERLATLTTCLFLVWHAVPLRCLAEARALVVVPVVTDSSDGPRLMKLASALRSALAMHQVLAGPARFASELEAASRGDDSLAQALELSDGFALLRYERYNDEIVRDHARRLAELVHAPDALIVAAPLANRFTVRRISRGDGESVTLPDPCPPSVVDSAVERLVPVADLPPAGEKQSERREARLWAAPSLGLVGLAAAVTATAFAVKRVQLSSRFAASPVDGPAYLARGDEWHALRAPMLWSAAGAAAVGSVSAALFALRYPSKHPLAIALLPLAVGVAAVTWAGVDLARGAPCPPDTGPSSACAGGETRFDRGLLLALASAPFLSFGSAQLARGLRMRGVGVSVDLSSQAAMLHLSLAQ